MATAIGIIGTFISAAGTIMGMSSAASQAKQQAQMVERQAQIARQVAERNAQITEQNAAYSAQVAERNAQIVEQNAVYQAKITERDVGQVRAAAQRQAAEQRRQQNIVQSRAMAIAAASGASTDDPTMLTIFGNLINESTLAVRNELYQGEAVAQQGEYQSMVDRVTASNQAKNIRWQKDVNTEQSKYDASLLRWKGAIGEITATQSAEAIRSEGKQQAAAIGLTGAGNLLSGGLGIYEKYKSQQASRPTSYMGSLNNSNDSTGWKWWQA